MVRTSLLSLLLLVSSICAAQYAEEKPEGKPYLKLGGAVRLNYNLSTWKKDQLERGGDFGFDVFRLNA